MSRSPGRGGGGGLWTPGSEPLLYTKPSAFIANISGQCLPYDDTCSSGRTLVPQASGRSQAQQLTVTLYRAHNVGGCYF
jgi:hypothetical protein